MGVFGDLFGGGGGGDINVEQASTIPDELKWLLPLLRPGWESALSPETRTSQYTPEANEYWTSADFGLSHGDLPGPNDDAWFIENKVINPATGKPYKAQELVESSRRPGEMMPAYWEFHGGDVWSGGQNLGLLKYLAGETYDVTEEVPWEESSAADRYTQMQDALMAVMRGEPIPGVVDRANQYFQSAIYDPAYAQFSGAGGAQEQLRQSYAGPGGTYWGGSRARAETTQANQFGDQMNALRAQVNQTFQDQAVQNLFSAIGVAPGIAPASDPRQYQATKEALAALGMPLSENIVSTSGGGSGLGSLIGGLLGGSADDLKGSGLAYLGKAALGGLTGGLGSLAGLLGIF